jgi:Transcriptional regulators
MAGRPTMKQIADAAGVSIATVSMALRNSPKITAETRAKVRAAAESLNYRPDPLIAALSTRRTEARPRGLETIAYLTAFPTREGWRQNRFSPAVYEGAWARAAQHGYRLEHFWLREPQMTPRRMADILQARGILGLCVAAFPEVVSHFSFPWEHFCSAAIGYSMMKPALHRACPHQFQGMQLTLNRLRRLGYERIGVALGRRVSKIVAQHWIASVLLFQYAHGRNAATCLVYEESDRVELRKWMQRHQPDAMVVSDIALLEWIRELGVRVPEEMGLVPLERYPGYASLDQKPEKVGAAAIDLIVGQIQRNETGLPADPRVVMVEGTWVDGPTVRPAPIKTPAEDFGTPAGWPGAATGV